MKKKILKLALLLILTTTLWAASAQQSQARSIWRIIWDVWFNPDKEWITSP